jgi:hypothetical protein
VALCNMLHSHYFLSFFAMDMLQVLYLTTDSTTSLIYYLLYC